ncbi:phage tail tape measure protein [Pseudomonas donghuensis]|uniref:Phage tail tape measure protein n=1 Tax=Pseudomonas donghuensis TaxID=1163398 RepID=A0AAP0SEJ3_9PSED|nr:phage tail tape measure protein [Pseudomonas donghuensis]KDN98909.1 phage tail tape measure protein [Pseudomonas donghuensis]MCP6691362.1 phage tail tape measure protein [Pseudomonas donghuensis]
MTTIASLGLRIDSGDAVEAANDLDKLADAGKRSEESAGKTGRAWESALSGMHGDTRQIVQELQALNAKQAELAQQMITVGRAVTTAAAGMTAFKAGAEQAGQAQAALTTATDAGTQASRRAAETADEQQARLATMARASLEASEYVQSLNRATAQTAEVTSQANAVLSDNASRQAAINTRAQALLATEERLAGSAKTAAAAQRDQGQALDDLLGKIDPTVAAMSRLDQMEQKLQGFKASGALDPETFAEYKKKVDQARAALGNADAALSSTGMTAKATAAALRGVPAQFTDIFTSIVAGQPIMMVALQQGGQLKDMFGGLGPAARALGGYILGLINPFTVSAAAAVTLGYAFYKGSEEADAYGNALILTANSAGLTSDQLGSMAKQVSATVGTTGAAASVLASLAGSGKIAGDSFMDVAQAAVSMEEAAGRAVSETIAEFVKLADDPVKASVALNTQYNYLTSSVYSQIAALEQQGRHADAVKLATEAFADAINERTPKIIENLSWWERGYNAVAKAADQLKNIGRESIDDDIRQAELNLAGAERGDVGAFQNQKEMVTFYTDQLQFLKDKKAAQEEIAAFDRQEADANEKTIKAMAKVDALEKSAWTNSKKRSEALKEYERSLDIIRKKDPSDARLNPEAVARVRSNIAEQYKDPAGRTGAVDLSGFNTQKNALNSILAEYKNNQKELDAAQKAGIISQESYAAQRAAIVEQQKDEVTNAYQAEIAALEAAKGKAGTSAAQQIQLDQKIADARANMVKAQKDADSELAVLATNEEGRLRKQAQAVQTYTSALDQQVKALRLQGQRSAEGLGLGDRQRGLQDQQNGIADRINQQKLDLANQYGDGSRGMSLDEYNQKLAALDKTQRDLQETAIANYNDMTAAQGSWSAGASSAFQNYLESARDVAGQTKSLFTNAFSSMEDAVANFAISGKFSFADFTKSILADMARIATRQAASGLLSSIAGSALGAWFSGGSAPTSAGSTQAGYSPEIMDNFVSGQRAAGGPVAANSLYQVNELGPELLNQGGKTYLMMGAEGGTITPLGAGPVSAAAAGAGGGSSIQINAPVSVVVPDRSSEGMELDQELLQQNMQKQMKTAAERAVAESWRPGGISYRNANGRR